MCMCMYMYVHVQVHVMNILDPRSGAADVVRICLEPPCSAAARAGGNGVFRDSE